MALEDKINAIRGKSENVRMLYIVAFVTIIMTFVVVLWIFSIRVDVQSVVDEVGSSATFTGRGDLEQIQSALSTSKSSIGAAIEQAAQVERAAQQDAAPAQPQPAAPQEDTATDSAATAEIP